MFSYEDSQFFSYVIGLFMRDILKDAYAIEFNSYRNLDGKFDIFGNVILHGRDEHIHISIQINPKDVKKYSPTTFYNKYKSDLISAYTTWIADHFNEE